MFIRISLKPMLFTKNARATLINLHRIERMCLENKKIEFYPGINTVFWGEIPAVIKYATHEEAEKRFNECQEMILPSKPQKQERWDMASPDALGMAALDDYKEVN